MVSSQWALGCGLLLGAVAWAAGPRVPTHVACVGDSITMGVGATTGMSYPSQLGALYDGGVLVGNFGHSGATLMRTGDLPYIQQPEYGAAQDFVSDAGVDAVVDVIIMLGTNDSKPYNWTPDGGVQAAQYASDALTLASVFANLSTHPAVYLAYPPWAAAAGTACCNISGPVIHDQIIPVLQQVAAQAGLPTIDVNSGTALHPEFFAADGVHPDDDGALFIAQGMQTGLARVPSVSVTGPAAGVSVSAPVSLMAQADAGTVLIQGLGFFVDGALVGSLAQPPYVLGASLSPGEHSVEAEVTDSTGASARSSALAFTVLAPLDGGILAPPADHLILHSSCSTWPVLSVLPLAMAALWLRRRTR